MRKIESGIYAIVHQESGRCYIGSAVNIVKRWDLHRHGLNRKKHHSAVMQRAWDKYGSEAFVFMVLELVENKADLLKREQHWIDTSDCVAPSGFNICPTAGSSFGRKFSQETRALLSKKRAGRKTTDETRARMSAAWKGRKKSEETKQAIGRGNTGKRRTAEHRAAVARANYERVHSPETRAKLSAAGKARHKKLREAKDRALRDHHQVAATERKY